MQKLSLPYQVRFCTAHECAKPHTERFCVYVCFFYPDVNAPDPVKEDERNTVRLWTLHCYTARYNVPIYTYNLSPNTAIYQKTAQEVVCVRQFNQYLLGLNCRCRGASTLLTNLLHYRQPLDEYDQSWEAQYGK